MTKPVNVHNSVNCQGQQSDQRSYSNENSNSSSEHDISKQQKFPGEDLMKQIDHLGPIPTQAKEMGHVKPTKPIAVNKPKRRCDSPQQGYYVQP